MDKLMLFVFHDGVETDGEEGNFNDGEGGATLRCETNLAWPDIVGRSKN